MKFQGLRLKGALALTLVLMAVVLAGSLTYLIGEHASHLEQQAVRTRLASLAEVTTHVLDAGMYERMHDIVGLAGVEQLRDPRRIDANRQLLESLRASMPDYAWLGFADTRGNVLYATRGMLEGEQVGERPWFIEGRQRLYLGDVHAAVLLAPLLGPHPAGQEWRFVDIAIPLMDTGGEPIGVLGAHLSWEWARGVEHTVLTTARRLAGVEIFIVNAAGQIIMAPRSNNDPRLPPLARLKEASDQVTWPDGQDYLTAVRTSSGYRDYPGLGWKVITRQPVEKAYASVRLLQMYIAGAGIVMAVVFGLLGLLLAHFLSRPLAELARRADQIRQGRTDLQLPAGGVFRETRQLSSSFGELLRELRQHEDELARFNASLEQQVADRTEAVDVANRHLMALLEERGELMQKLEALAATDSLTGLLNRRAFEEKAATEDRRAQRQHTPISVLTFDIDHFKQVNDRHGHDIGDEALRQCARACAQQLREIDLFARFGGEEFVILLPETDVPGAELLAERLRLTIAGLRIETAQGILQFTASFGIAPHVPGQDLATALQRADQALYAAKHSGRNRVVVYF